MPTLIEQAEQITAKAATLRAEAGAIADKATGSPEDLARVKAGLAEADGLDARAAELRETAAAVAKSREVEAGYRVPQPRKATSEGREPVVARESFLDDPKRGYETPRAFLFDVLAHDMGQMAKVKRPSNLRSLRVVDVQAAAGSDEQGGYANPYGGFAVPTGLVPGLQTRGFDGDPIGALVTPLPMASPVVRVNARTDSTHTSSVSGGLTVTRRAETTAGTASRMQMEQVEFQASSLFGLAYATEEILRDSPMSFAALLEAGFRDEFGAKLMDERLNGTGAGELEGIINCPATVSVSKETGQVAATLVTKNVLNMRARCWGYAKAVWYANPTLIPQLALLTIDVGTGGVPVFMPSLREDVPDMLLGRPIFFGEFAKTAGTVGDIVLGNWSQYLEGTYEPLQGASSVHVRFVNHEQTFKFWLRNCGKSWWRAALTPKNGNTLSPFITLATRS